MSFGRTPKPMALDGRRLPKPVDTPETVETRRRAEMVKREFDVQGPRLRFTETDAPVVVRKSITGSLDHLETIWVGTPKPTERDQVAAKLPTPELRQLAERQPDLSAPLLRTVAYAVKRSEAENGGGIGKARIHLSDAAKATGLNQDQVERLLAEAVQRGLLAKHRPCSTRQRGFFGPLSPTDGCDPARPSPSQGGPASWSSGPAHRPWLRLGSRCRGRCPFFHPLHGET